MDEKNPFGDIEGNHGCLIEDLEIWEIPLLLIRKHWIAYLWVGVLLIILIGIVIGIMLFGQVWNIPPLFTWLTAFGIGMVGIQFIFVQWINIELDIFIITNKRLIEYDQTRFLNRRILQASIDQIQEVEAATEGLFSNIIWYGEIIIKTAGDPSDFELKTIPRALENSRIMHALIDEHRHALGGKI